jgi:hypothetical protein
MTRPSPERLAAYRLIKTGTLVQFEVTDTHIEPSLGDEGNSIVKIELQLGAPEADDDDGEDDSGGDGEDQAEWGGFGFLFTLATLSFADARPRSYTGPDFVENDEFSVADFFDCLRFVRGELHLDADYIRDRCVKTTIIVRRDGQVTLETRNRGEAATRWIDRLRGKKALAAVP